MRFRKIAAALLTLALGFCLCQPAAFAATAADQHTQLQELPVSIQSTGETPLPKETLTVELEAVDNAPLPQVTTLEITDGENGSFGPISYTKPGYYVYTVRQRAGVNTRGTYDETAYCLYTAAGQRNRNHTGPFVRFEKVPFPMEEILFDPQTSGGLLFAVAPQDAAALEAELQAVGLPAKIVGPIGEKQTPEITVTYE